MPTIIIGSLKKKKKVNHNRLTVNDDALVPVFKSIREAGEFTIHSVAQFEWAKVVLRDIQNFRNKNDIAEILERGIDEYVRYDSRPKITSAPEIIKPSSEENPCIKVSYDTKDLARRALNNIWGKGRKKAPIRAYKCRNCGKFHLTSQLHSYKPK